MKSLSLCAVALVLALGAVPARAELTLIEDFEGYEVDTSIHLQGDDGTGIRPARALDR